MTNDEDPSGWEFADDDEISLSAPDETAYPAPENSGDAGEEFILIGDEPVPPAAEETEEAAAEEASPSLVLTDAEPETKVYQQYAPFPASDPDEEDTADLLTRHEPFFDLCTGTGVRRILLIGGAPAMFFLLCMNFWGGMSTPEILTAVGGLLLAGFLWKLIGEIYAEREYRRQREEYEENLRLARANVKKMQASPRSREAALQFGGRDLGNAETPDWQN